MPARLVDQESAHVVEPFRREAALLENRRALEGRHTAGDYAERLAGCVIVDRFNTS
jgi:hypothetical protein